MRAHTHTLKTKLDANSQQALFNECPFHLVPVGALLGYCTCVWDSFLPNAGASRRHEPAPPGGMCWPKPFLHEELRGDVSFSRRLDPGVWAAAPLVDVTPRAGVDKIGRPCRSLAEAPPRSAERRPSGMTT